MVRSLCELDPVMQADPEQLTAEARALAAVSDNLDTTARVLLGLSTKATWVSESGTEFGSRIDEVPVVLMSVSHRLEFTADLIAGYAPRLRDRMERLRDIDRRYVRAAERMEDCDRRLESMDDQDPARAALVEERGEAAEESYREEQRFIEASDDAQDAEAWLAGDLSDGPTILDDPGGYDLLEGMQDLGRSRAVNGPWASVIKPLGAVAVLDPIGGAGLKLFYGEGEWRDVGAASIGFGLGLLVKGLGAGVTKTGKQKNTYRQKGPMENLSIRSTQPKAPVTSSWAAARRSGGNAIAAVADHGARREFGLKTAESIAGDWAAVSGRSNWARRVVVVQSSARVAADVHSTVTRNQDRAKWIQEQRAPTDRKREDERRATAESLETPAPADAREPAAGTPPTASPRP